MAGKADFVDHLTHNLEGMSKKQAAEAFDVIVDFLIDQLADGERVQIPGLGAFSVSERKERQGRNPKTKEPITIPASNVVRFKPGKALKDAVNE